MLLCSVVVTYNGAEWIEKCLSSLVNSAMKGEHQVIVIDNSSVDGTIPIIKNQFPQVELVETGDNLGFGKANNIGILKAIERNADYVFLLNQDAWVDTDTIQRLVSVSSENKEYGIVSPMHLNGDRSYIDYYVNAYIAKNQSISRHILSDRYQNKTDQIYTIDFVNAAIWLLPLDCVKKIGLFDPVFFHYGEDKNYANRVKYHNYKIGLVPAVTACHDRERVVTRKKTYARYKLMYTGEMLNNLCNLNNSLGFATCKNILVTFRNCLRNVFRGQLQYSWADILVLFKYLGKLGLVVKSRSVNKKEFIAN